MDIDIDFDDMKNFLELQSNEVQSNCTIVTPETMGCTHALHIDKTTPNVFVPRMPKSASSEENDSCARVTVAGTLLGCYIGYYRGEADFIRGVTKSNDDVEGFLGGYSICRLDFNHALKPNQSLVFDAERSEELWLVAYNQQNVKYVPKIIGKMFVTHLEYSKGSGVAPKCAIKFCVENNDSLGMWLTRDKLLDVGYWAIEATWDNIQARTIELADCHLGITKLDKDSYERSKSLTAAFLSRHADALPSKPEYLSW